MYSNQAQIHLFKLDLNQAQAQAQIRHKDMLGISLIYKGQMWHSSELVMLGIILICEGQIWKWWINMT